MSPSKACLTKLWFPCCVWPWKHWQPPLAEWPRRTWAFMLPFHFLETSWEWTLVSLFSSATNLCIVTTWFWKWSQSQAPSLSVCVCLAHGGVSELWSPCCVFTTCVQISKIPSPPQCVLYLCYLKGFWLSFLPPLWNTVWEEMVFILTVTTRGVTCMGGLWNTCPWAQRGASALLRPPCQWCGPSHLFSKHFIHYFLFLLFLCQQAV